MTETVSKIIVDSRYFVSGYASSGIHKLPKIVEIHGTQALYLEQLSLMNTWFIVDETNNRLYLVEWTYGISGHYSYTWFRPRIISMPIAPYDINSFATQLQTLLNGLDKSLKSTYSVSRTSNDPTTGATSVALAQNFTITLTDVPPRCWSGILLSDRHVSQGQGLVQ